MKRTDFGQARTYLSKGNVFGKPALYRVVVGERSFMVKDVREKHFLMRWTLGLWLIQKEWKIYSRLKGVGGIPEPIERVGLFAFVMEFVSGRPIERGKPLPLSFFSSLEQILQEIHLRGVAHLDLRHKGNILLSEAGTPILIDFNSGFSVGKKGFFRRLLFPFLRWVDHGGLLKLKERISPDLLTSEEQSFLKRFNRIRKLWIFN